MHDRTERSVIGVFTDAEGNTYDVIEEVRRVKFFRLSGQPTKAPGSKFMLRFMVSGLVHWLVIRALSAWFE